MIGLAVLDILYPLLNKYAIEEFFTKQNFTNIKLFIGAYCLIAIGYGVVVHGFIRMAGLVEVEVGYELRHEAFVNYNYYLFLIMIRLMKLDYGAFNF